MLKTKLYLCSILFMIPLSSWSQCINLSGVFSAMNGSNTYAFKIEQKDCVELKLSLGSFVDNSFHEEFDVGTYVAEGKQEFCPDQPKFKCPEFIIKDDSLLFIKSFSESFENHGICYGSNIIWNRNRSGDLVKKFIVEKCDDNFSGILVKIYSQF